MSTLIGGVVVIAVAVLVLEDLRVNDVFQRLVRLVLEACLNEVVLFELEFSLSGDGSLVELLCHNVIFGVAFKISLEVVAVHLFFFCETAEEVSVVLSPSLALSLEHALLPALVILGVSELSCSELLNLVEGTIEATNSLLNVVPGLIEILSIRCWQVYSVLSKLTINFSK